MGNFNNEYKIVLDNILLNNPLIREGKMFGYPAYYVGKKLSICLYEHGVSVKLPLESVESLLEKDNNVSPFQPMGNTKMKEWIFINVAESKEILKYQSIFEESIQYIISLQNGK